MARRYGQADLFEGMVSDKEPLITPKGASEFEIKARLVCEIGFVFRVAIESGSWCIIEFEVSKVFVPVGDSWEDFQVVATSLMI